MEKLALNKSIIIERIKRDLSNIRAMFSNTDNEEKDLEALGPVLQGSLNNIEAYAAKYYNSTGGKNKSRGLNTQGKKKIAQAEKGKEEKSNYNDFKGFER